MVLHRIALPFINAVFITACLLYLMFSLINVGEPELLAKAKVLKMNWVRVPDDKPPVTMNPKPKPNAEVELPPEVMQDKTVVEIDIQGEMNWVEPSFEFGGDGSVYVGDSQLVLALGYPPAYPQSLANRGVEGYVVVGFSVSASGQVYDPFIIESEPARIFDRSALTAIAKFKYKARVVNDKPVSTGGQRYLFRYELDR